MDDVEMYKSYKGPVTELHIVDQYMKEVQCLATTLKIVMSFGFNLPRAECNAAPPDVLSLRGLFVSSFTCLLIHTLWMS